MTPNWSANLEYAFSDFARAGVYFPIAGEHNNSNLTLQTVQLGLNYRFADDPGPAPASTAGILPNLNDWSIHAQSTIIGQGIRRSRRPIRAKTASFPSIKCAKHSV